MNTISYKFTPYQLIVLKFQTFNFSFESNIGPFDFVTVYTCLGLFKGENILKDGKMYLIYGDSQSSIHY